MLKAGALLIFATLGCPDGWVPLNVAPEFTILLPNGGIWTTPAMPVGTAHWCEYKPAAKKEAQAKAPE